MMEIAETLRNMEIYEAVRAVPEEAKKTIGGGRLKGMTDINPMWRIKTLTQLYGPCGIGWKVENVNFHTQRMEQSGEVSVFCQLDLLYKDGDKWAAPIFGIGGSMLIVKENSGIRLDDEAYKKAYTDAMSVACKALGIGADVYWASDRTKYTFGADVPKSSATTSPTPTEDTLTCEGCGGIIKGVAVKNKGMTTQYAPAALAEKSKQLYGKCLCYECMAAMKKKAAG